MWGGWNTSAFVDTSLHDLFKKEFGFFCAPSCGRRNSVWLEKFSEISWQIWSVYQVIDKEWDGDSSWWALPFLCHLWIPCVVLTEYWEAGQMVAGEGISRADLGSGGIRAGSGTGRRTVPPEYKLQSSNSNTSCMAVYNRGLLACLCSIKPLHNADSITTRYLLTLLSSMFLLTKTLQVPVFFFFLFPLFHLRVCGLISWCSVAITVCRSFSWTALFLGLWKCPFWLFAAPTWCLGSVSDVLGSVTPLIVCYADLHICHNFKPFEVIQNEFVWISLDRNMETLDWEGKFVSQRNAVFNTAIWAFYICVNERTAVLDKDKGPPRSSALSSLALVRCGCPDAAVEGVKSVKPATHRLPGGTFLKWCSAVKSHAACLLYMCISEGL